MTDLSLSVRIYADAVRYAAGLADGVTKTKRWGTAIKAEVAAVRDAFGGVTGQIAGLAGGITAVSVAADSAKLDKALTGIKLTAGASREEVEALRKDFFQMAKDSGRNVDDLRQGFSNLIAMGQSWKAAREQTAAVNTAMAVTNASAEKLTGALGVAGTAFGFDLEKPGLALQLLDQMTVAGRKGNAELEHLSDIFARVGVNAADAGMGFESSLAFIETLSQVERQPERLATLADSTIRLFNNQNYRKEAEKATGVKFFDAKGSRRDALVVLTDLKKQYDRLKSAAAREDFISKAFGKADQDTIKGMRILLKGDSLTKVGTFTDEIAKAGGTLKREMPEAISNAVDQTGRLKAALREATDAFSQPINDTLQQAIKWGMDSKENGGLALSGQDMLLGGAGLAAGSMLAARYGGKAIGALLGKGTDLATGVATGKALEEAAGVQSVYVVNMPGSGITGGAAAADAAATAAAAGAATSIGTKIKTGLAMAGGLQLKDFVKLGPAALGTTATGVAAAGTVGYGVGTGMYKWVEGTKVGDAIVDVVGGGLTRLMAALGNEDAQRTMDMVNRIKDTEIKGTVSVTVHTAPGVQASVTSSPANRNTSLPVGRTMDGVR